MYRANPPRARYDRTWDIDPVLRAWDKPNESLSLADLTIKTFTLLAAATMGRGADLRAIAASDHSVVRDAAGRIKHINLLKLRLPKQQRSGPLLPVKVLAVDNSNLCPARACLSYMAKTTSLRDPLTPELFITTKRPHKAIAPKTGADWLLKSMEQGE